MGTRDKDMDRRRGDHEAVALNCFRTPEKGEYTNIRIL